MVQEKQLKLVRVWWSLIIPPLLLTILTMGVATYIGIKTQGQSEAINQGILSSLPYILMVNHAILFLILLAFLKADGITLGSIGWQLPYGKKSLLSEPLIGIGTGIVLGLFGYFALEPLLEMAQHIMGDYQESAYIVGSRIPWLIGGTVFAVLSKRVLPWLCYSAPQSSHGNYLGRCNLITLVWSSPFGTRFVGDGKRNNIWFSVCRYFSLAQKFTGARCRACYK